MKGGIRFLKFVATLFSASCFSRSAQISGRRAVMTSPGWKNWNDVSAYPMIAVLGGTIAMCTGFMVLKMAKCPDVRIGSKTKGEVLRTWDGSLIGK
jgi:hypothetical protein